MKITNDQGEKLAVIIPIEEYQKILDALEELEDIQLYDEVKHRNEPTLLFSEYLKTRKENT